MAADDQRRATPSMYDVAALAGVSHQTVSRVLNGFPRIRQETRERVLAAIAQLGYRPNLAARTLATSRSRAVGILAPDAKDYGPTSTVQALEAATRASGYHPLVTTSAIDPESIGAALGFLLDQAIEALVIVAPHVATLEAIGALDVRIPVVVLQSGPSEIGLAFGIDQYAGAELAVRHLLELGHRRIQHVAGPASYLEARERRRAFSEIVREAGLEELPVLAGDWTAASGERAAAGLAPGVTAVFCANDQMALGLISGLATKGLTVPADLSVVGFDDVPEAAFYLPPLTTVRQDFEELGARAVELLVRRLDGADEIAPAAVPPTLATRRSTAAPRG